MAYRLRPKRQNVAYADPYADSTDTESDSNNHDQDYSRFRPRKPTKRRNATPSTRRTMKTEMVDSGVNSNAKRRRGTRSHPSKKTAAGGQNKEASRVGQSSRMERGSILRESPSPTTENGTPSPVRQGSPSPCKKTGDEGHNNETGEVGQSLGMEKSIFLPEDTSSSMGNTSPSPVGQDSPSTLQKTLEEGSNKETRGVGKSSRKEKGSFSQEGPHPSTENSLPSTEGHSSSMKRVSSLPEGTSSSQKTILSWLIDCKTIEEDEQVYYKDDTKESAPITGAITRVGILCSCCQEEISVWTFEKHADSDLKKPYKHICLPKKGTCLRDSMTTAWYKSTEQKSREPFDYTLKEQNNSACLICGDGGDLFYCTNKKCQSAYHAFCMNMKRVPRGTWNCPYCLCKYCGLECQLQPITCLQCDKIFHLECFNKFSKESSEISSSRLYCTQSCKEIYEKLESSLAARTDIGEGNSWRVIQPMDMISKLHIARTLRLENNLKVAVAFTLMNESFKTITDRDTGIDVVHGVLYSRRSDLKRINFSHFHTFILEKDDAIICAASIRIHGRRVAEMPFIATDEPFRGQGFCSKLMTAIESYLHDLKVQNLIIPAVPDTSEMWKVKYGFKELTRELKREVSSYNILKLTNTEKLYKDLSSLDRQTEIHNAQQTQNDNTQRALLDLNMDPA
ncbi:Increased DNA methylation 1 [Spatholobus suberectus]|nr:Increased DNA methylation 1 [Spatholobus suberectus]